MTLADLCRRMSWYEFQMWLGLYGIEPWPEDRGDIRAANVAAAAYRSQGVKVELSELMPDYRGEAEEEQAEDDIKAVFRAIAVTQEKINGQ
jgi:hypothetical protein